MTKNNRIEYLDLVKGVAILLVCIGHAYYIRIGDLGGSVSLDNSVLRKLIYSFHMPLFMVLCGFFSTTAYQTAFNRLLRKKFVQLIVPILTCISLSLGMHFFSGHLSLSLIKAEGIAMLWFLKVLFICYLIVYLFLRITKGNEWFACMLSLIIVFFIPYSDINSLNWYLFIFWFGIFWRNYYDAYMKNIRSVTFIATFIFVISVLLAKATYLEATRWDLIFKSPTQYMIQLVVSLSGAFMVIGSCHFIEKFFRNHWLPRKVEMIGQYSLGIFVTQYIVLEGFCKKYLLIAPAWTPNIKLYDFFIAPAIGILASITCFYLTRLLAKNRYINYLLLGNQY